MLLCRISGYVSIKMLELKNVLGFHLLCICRNLILDKVFAFNLHNFYCTPRAKILQWARISTHFPKTQEAESCKTQNLVYKSCKTHRFAQNLSSDCCWHRIKSEREKFEETWTEVLCKLSYILTRKLNMR